MDKKTPQQPVRIASASGSITDMAENLAELAKNANVDFIVGDWMSEYNMSVRGMEKVKRYAQEANVSDEASFEAQFVDSFTAALPDLARRGVKLAVNAGASDTEQLHAKLTELVASRGLDVKISWVEGDEVLPAVKQCLEGGDELKSISTGQRLRDWPYEPVYAQCYLGCWGIVEAFKHGADVVVCGRVADASPTMAAAAYWFGWERTQFGPLAHSLVAGHLIECSYYVTGGNFSGFKTLPTGKIPLLHMPVARVQADGTFFIECHSIENRGGAVTVDTCRAQLVYELQGPLYYNADVVAVLPGIQMEQAGPNSVFVHGIDFLPPPPTTKVGLTAHGGFVAEVHYYLSGLDVEAKARMLENQLRYYLDIGQMSQFRVMLAGVAASNPVSQDASTVEMRIIAQAPTAEALSRANFLTRCWALIMSTYPGATFAVDYRTALPRAYCEYFATILPLNLVNHVAHSPWAGKQTKIEALPSDKTVPYTDRQESQAVTSNPVRLDSFGPTVTAPLGLIVHARSGDKASDCNVGFFAREADEYDWLRSFLSTTRIIELLQNDYTGNRIDRFELPHIRAVHFLLKDHLDRGVASNVTYDVLGKNAGEYLRAKHVPLPKKFLERGSI